MSVTEIAKRAGVSVATVSRVLNGHPRVRPETEMQVRRVLEKVRYVRPLIRRGPKLGRRARSNIGNIAVLAAGFPTPNCFRQPVFANVLASVIHASRAIEANVVVDHVPDSQDVAYALRNRNVDGALVLLPASMNTPIHLQDSINRDLPIVRIMGESLTASQIDHVAPDNAAVGHLAFGYLASRGCRELVFVTAKPEWELNRVRALGFASAARRVGISPTCYIISNDAIDADYFGPRTVRCASEAELADRLAGASPRPDGIFFSRDKETATFWPMLQQRAIKPESDLTVVSCDNDDIELSVLFPRPASVDLDAEEIGRRALARLAERIRKPDDPAVRILVVPRLVHPHDSAATDHTALA